MSGQIALLVLVIIGVAIVVGLVWSTMQRRRTDRLREQFGPEYERTVETAHDRSKAESELQARAERVERLEIQPLDPAASSKFAERWRVVQAMFVDDPALAVEQADALIGDVMRARGYPVGDFEQRAADISVNHPQVVDHYRTAHEIAKRNRAAGAGRMPTEDLRQAFVHYRALFADLLETPDSAAEPELANADATAQADMLTDVRDRASTDAPGTRSTARAVDRTTTTTTTDSPAEPARRA